MTNALSPANAPSPFQSSRSRYAPRCPEALRDLAALTAEPLAETCPEAALESLFPQLWSRGLSPLRFSKAGATKKASKSGRAPRAEAKVKAKTIGVVLSGGPAPGGHNVILGMVEALADLTPTGKVLGFLGGPSGILEDKTKDLTPAAVAPYRNTGGFDLLGSGRTKIETTEQLERCREVLEARGVDVLVVIGGDDSNTNAAVLAEYLLAAGSPVRVLGVPKTIDGDLKNEYVETSFGFDTAVRVYSDLIANIARDTLSAKKYYHFVRLMGRSASHITLEAALQTQPNIALVAEEVAAAGKTLRQVVEDLAEVVKARAAVGKNFGMVLVPEGVIEFIPEMKALIRELNDILAAHKAYVETLSGFTAQSEYVNGKLSKDASYTFSSLPIDIQRQLLMDRDPHGNVIVSGIETEKLLIEMLKAHLAEEKAEGRFVGRFGYQRHFLGYEGRCAAPSNFDADYAYSLGRVAVALATSGVTGYMCVVRQLTRERREWEAMGVPLLAMMTIESRKGRDVPVIRKSLVDLGGKSIQYLNKHRSAWAAGEHYRCPGPIQYFGPEELCDKVPCVLALEADRATQVPW